MRCQSFRLHQDGRENRGEERSPREEPRRSCLRNVCLPAACTLPGAGGWFSGKGPFTFIERGTGGLTAHVTALSALPSSIPVTASLPPLEWPLSHQSGAYELRIEVQPKPHHRAHYETEGSRGAVKAPTGGHPVVQVWTRVPFLPCPRGPLGRSLLRSFCLVLIRLRCVSQLPIPRRDGKSQIECRTLKKPLRSQEKRFIFLFSSIILPHYPFSEAKDPTCYVYWN